MIDEGMFGMCVVFVDVSGYVLCLEYLLLLVESL